jgi:hypothetical protein
VESAELPPILRTNLLAHWTYDGASTTFADDPDYYGYDHWGSYNLQKSGAGPDVADTAAQGANAVGYHTSNYHNLEFTLSTTDFRMPGDFSVSMWIRNGAAFTGPNWTPFIVDGGDWTVQGATGSDGRIYMVTWDTVAGSTFSNWYESTDGLWRHYGFAYDSTTLTVTMYVNGSSEVTSGTAGALPNGLQQSAIVFKQAYATSSGGDSDLEFDDVMVWKGRKLTGKEFTEIMVQTS